MQLTGSRSTQSSDEFSDWDHLIETEEDFVDIRKHVDAAVVWQLSALGPIKVVTLVDGEGVLWDFTGQADRHVPQWDALAAAQVEPMVHAFWIFSFKHLKAIYRRYYTLVSVGIEASTGLARDIYLGRKYGAGQYKNFFAFKAIADAVGQDTALAQVTGMPYAVRAQMLAKIRALNDLVAEVAPDVGREPGPVYDRRAALLG